MAQLVQSPVGLSERPTNVADETHGTTERDFGNKGENDTFFSSDANFFDATPLIATMRLNTNTIIKEFFRVLVTVDSTKVDFEKFFFQIQKEHVSGHIEFY